MDREQVSEETYARLFGPRDTNAPDLDPEFGRILRTFIFADVFTTGDLDDAHRELVAVVCLTTLGTLPQLKAHLGGALNVGNSPVALREAIYTCAGFIGFPRTLQAIGVLNEVLTDRGIDLPLPPQGTVTDDERRKAGWAIQGPLYGDEIRALYAGLPAPFADAIPTFLTEFGFGDFYTRGGLDAAEREFVVLICLTALGGTEFQLGPHALANLKLGTSLSTLLAAVLHCWPYVGFPRASAALRVLATLDTNPTDA
ncbi:MAG: carboxymuconolactone decarboxylase family protein [Propionibacteriaceae bacterium]|jgi:4-carboxymuconolactone decarboxylase|nr:carboxymuconolactone decarboxylase family protein [Micropruina sp.]HBX82479.1 4-carboxymuconolactone decarboxylase [Propionibacteriaceae bacterium]HBY23487.1 4-carboxymuconolactone decarboxylase [Propionibacteriaceae bacterium]